MPPYELQQTHTSNVHVRNMQHRFRRGHFCQRNADTSRKAESVLVELLEGCARPYMRGLGKQSTHWHSSTDLCTSGEVFMPRVAANACTAR